jgi:hypothetical protein
MQGSAFDGAERDERHPQECRDRGRERESGPDGHIGGEADRTLRHERQNRARNDPPGEPDIGLAMGPRCSPLGTSRQFRIGRAAAAVHVLRATTHCSRETTAWSGMMSSLLDRMRVKCVEFRPARLAVGAEKHDCDRPRSLRPVLLGLEPLSDLVDALELIRPSLSDIFSHVVRNRPHRPVREIQPRTLAAGGQPVLHVVDRGE